MQTTENKYQNSVIVEIEMNIKTDEFEGPLGLLLTLITRNKLDITKISLVKIVDQYIEYSQLHKPDLKTSAEFVRIASILLYLKAIALSDTQENIDEDMEAETQNLLSQLEVISQFRKLRDILKLKRKERKMMISKSVKKNIAKMKQYSIDDIIKYAVKYFINAQRNKKFQLKRDEISTSRKIEEIKNILKIQDHFRFSEFVISKPVIEIVASFMAILETTKSEITNLAQEKNFDEILVSKRM